MDRRPPPIGRGEGAPVRVAAREDGGRSVHQPVPMASRVFDHGVFASGGLVLLAALVSVVSDLHREDVHPAVLLGIPVAVLMAHYPLVLTRSKGGIEVGFDSAVLVFLACVAPADVALLVWCLSVVIAQLTAPKRVQVRLFNTGLGAIAGALALATMTSLSSLRNTGPRELLAVALGCAVYFVVDYVLSAVSVALEERRPLTPLLAERSVLGALGVFVAIDSLGYLGALVLRALPTFASVLLAVPVATILVATRALSRGHEHRRRLAALFDAAAAVQSRQSRPDLTQALAEHAQRVVLSGEARVGATPPATGEIGARVRTGGDEVWLVAPARDRARASVEADQRALEALAAVGEEAFARLGLVDEMSRRARHDALTGLANRTLFLDRVEQAVAQGRRGGPRLAVLFLDLDGFKSVNDRFGHDAGDELLVAVAERVASCLRAGDSVARLGGDEFAVLLHDVETIGQVELVCHRLLAALREEISVAGHEVLVEGSIGVAVASAEDTAEDLLHNADMAMYRAKALGKARFAMYEPELRTQNIKRLELIERLRRGVADELVVHYQPVVELATGEFTGIEALVRWQRGRQLVCPEAFIGVAEQSGLVVDVGERVLAQMVADAPTLTAAAGRPLALGVNVSAHQLREPGFHELVRSACAELGENTLVLEMTETVLIGDDEETVATLATLAATGAVLAIDDFGVGFSSIGYLQHLPVDILKIDRSFTASIDCDERADALVRAMVLMGSALGLRVVAEGIERRAQLERVQLMGCAAGQGYFFSAPRPLERVVPLLRDARPRALVGFPPLPRQASEEH